MNRRRTWQLRQANNWLLRFRDRAPFWFDVMAFFIALVLVIFALLFFL